MKTSTRSLPAGDGLRHRRRGRAAAADHGQDGPCHAVRLAKVPVSMPSSPSAKPPAKTVKRDAFGHVKLDTINVGNWFQKQFAALLDAESSMVQKSGYFARSAPPMATTCASSRAWSISPSKARSTRFRRHRPRRGGRQTAQRHRIPAHQGRQALRHRPGGSATSWTASARRSAPRPPPRTERTEPLTRRRRATSGSRALPGRGAGRRRASRPSRVMDAVRGTRAGHLSLPREHRGN